MRKRWMVRGILACAALVGSVHLAQAQAMSSGSAAGSSGGASSSSGGGAGVGTISGAAGTSGQGIASLGTTGGSGGGGGGGGGGGRSGSGATQNVVPQTSDPLQSTYANPYAIGVSGVSTQFTVNTTTGGVSTSAATSGNAFGTPVYTQTTTNSNNTGANSYTSMNTGGFSTINTVKTHAYSTVLGRTLPVIQPLPTKLQSEILTSLESSSFTNKRNILVRVDGSTVFLKGQVADENERRVMEGFVRMTPGVRDVVNQLVPLQEQTASNR